MWRTRRPSTRPPRRVTSVTKKSNTLSGPRSCTTSRSSTRPRIPYPINTFAFDGTWTDHAQEATAGSDAQIYLHFVANDVYLVMGGTGTVDVSFNGRPLSTVKVSGVPRLYTLFSGNALQTGQLDLRFSPGVQAYDFTFG